MKISAFGFPDLAIGKHNVRDPRLDQVDKLVNAKKKTYVQLESVAEDKAPEADAILAAKEVCTDLVLKDLDFVETRLSRCESEEEKLLLNKLKSILEKEAMEEDYLIQEIFRLNLVFQIKQKEAFLLRLEKLKLLLE